MNGTFASTTTVLPPGQAHLHVGAHARLVAHRRRGLLLVEVAVLEHARHLAARGGAGSRPSGRGWTACAAPSPGWRSPRGAAPGWRPASRAARAARRTSRRAPSRWPARRPRTSPAWRPPASAGRRWRPGARPGRWPPRLLELRQRALRQLQERLVVLAQRLGGERFEGLAELLLGLLQQRQLRLRRPGAPRASSVPRRTPSARRSEDSSRSWSSWPSRVNSSVRALAERLFGAAHALGQRGLLRPARGSGPCASRSPSPAARRRQPGHDRLHPASADTACRSVHAASQAGSRRTCTCADRARARAAGRTVR